MVSDSAPSAKKARLGGAADTAGAAAWGEGPLYLGFDLSTQSCKALIINESLGTVGQSRVHFDTDLPHHGTRDGCHRGDGGRVTSPTLMWVEALELALDRLKAQGCPFDRIAAVSGSGQQHGSVYWRREGLEALRKLDPSRGTAAEQLRAAFAAEHSPIWMDTSTSRSCEELTALLGGGALGVAALTGSTAQERFSAHHFRRFIAEKGLKDVGALSLVSSLGASLLVGEVVPIDVSDAAGMNLMDIRRRRWEDRLLDWVAPGEVEALRGSLAEPQDSWSVAGCMHSYWAQRFGFLPGCKVVTWSGDNPCAVIGNGLVRPGDVLVSLGTSDTALLVLPEVPKEPLPFGHLFPHPILRGCYWSMLCYTNGDVTRRRVRDAYFSAGGAGGGEADDGGWGSFAEALRSTAPGNGGAAGLFFSTDEVTPAISNGPDLRGKVDQATGELKELGEFEDPKQNARAVVEMRALAIRNHLEKLMPAVLSSDLAAGEGSGGEPHLLLTGGASSSSEIRQVFADVFGRPVRCMDTAEGAAFGAAVRALHGARPEAETTILAKLRSFGAVRARPQDSTQAASVALALARRSLAALEAKAVAERGRM